LQLRAFRRDYEKRLELVKLLDDKIVQSQVLHDKLLGPRSLEHRIQAAVQYGMEVESYTLTLHEGSTLADPSSPHDAFIKVGDRFRLGNSPVVYRAASGVRPHTFQLHQALKCIYKSPQSESNKDSGKQASLNFR